MIFLVFFWSHKSNLLKMMCFFFWFRLMIASNSLFRLENGIRASRIYRKTSTFLQFYSMFLRALRICPGNQLMVSATLVIDFIRNSFVFINFNSAQNCIFSFFKFNISQSINYRFAQTFYLGHNTC